MTDESYQRKFAELDSLLNDPNMPLSPARIWELMGEISGHAAQLTKMDQGTRPVAAE